MRYWAHLVHPHQNNFKLKFMFKSKFQEAMKRSEGFEVIKDADALSVQGGRNCNHLQSCGTYTGSCSTLSSCQVFDNCEVK